MSAAAELFMGYVTEFLPQISVALTLAALRELYRTNKQINENEEQSVYATNLAEVNREIIAEEHDYEGLKKAS